MQVTTAPSSLRRCERCGGQMYVGYEGEHSCLWCGEIHFPAAPAIQGAEDVDAWRVRLRGKPGRPRRDRSKEQGACA